jgi:hypothetical protein
MTPQQIEESAQALTEVVRAMIRHRDNHPSDDREPSTYNEALDAAWAKIQAAQGRGPQVKGDPIEDELVRKIEALGEAIYASGGNRAMSDVSYRVYDIMVAAGDGRDADVGAGIINHRWDGIGDWSA